ncbi:hypothetical protein PAMP_000058 [Pampus punctatissimus]
MESRSSVKSLSYYSFSLMAAASSGSIRPTELSSLDLRALSNNTSCQTLRLDGSRSEQTYWPRHTW